MYRSTEEVLAKLESNDIKLSSVTRYMYKYFKRKDIEKWLMFAKAKTQYQMNHDLED